MITGIAASDFNALSELKAQAAQDAKGTALEVARQFEGIFLQSMLKSMRLGVHFLDESSPFRGKDRETFEDMLDAQYASEIAGNKGVGLADMLQRHLESVSANARQTSGPSVIPMDISPIKSSTDPSEPRQASNVLEEFIKSIWPQAKAAAANLGLDPKLLVAQAALETGWGKFINKDSAGESTNNLFNIKLGNNKTFASVTVPTTEYTDNQAFKTTAEFRKYASVNESLQDYVHLIRDDARYNLARANAQNPARYVEELSRAGYATDPHYGEKILAIFHGTELNQAVSRLEDEVAV